jgi:hypothetical protein
VCPQWSHKMYTGDAVGLRVVYAWDWVWRCGMERDSLAPSLSVRAQRAWNVRKRLCISLTARRFVWFSIGMAKDDIEKKLTGERQYSVLNSVPK